MIGYRTSLNVRVAQIDVFWIFTPNKELDRIQLIWIVYFYCRNVRNEHLYLEFISFFLSQYREQPISSCLVRIKRFVSLSFCSIFRRAKMYFDMCKYRQYYFAHAMTLSVVSIYRDYFYKQVHWLISWLAGNEIIVKTRYAYFHSQTDQHTQIQIFPLD